MIEAIAKIAGVLVLIDVMLCICALPSVIGWILDKLGW